jgi:hypothetical protein
MKHVFSLVQPASDARIATQLQLFDQFLSAPSNRAFAIAPGRQASMRVSGAATQDLADEMALERCQIRNGEACVLFASNETVRTPTANGEWARREMERVRYSGPFRPDHVPGISPERRRESDLAGYASAREPKAIAIHPLGYVAVVTGAASKRAAEDQALRTCNDDPARIALAGHCFLYATGMEVVLPGRHEEPLAAAPAPPPPAAQGTDLRPSLLQELIAAVPFVPRSVIEPGLTSYVSNLQHKAIAIAPGAASYWRTYNADSDALAEERVLEACQLRYGIPCILFAVDENIRRPPAGADWPRRDMPRLSYSGSYDAQRIPAISPNTRASTTVVGYGPAPDPKAMAIHPSGRVFIVTGAASAEAAENDALAHCDSEVPRDGPCLLYASANTVVLPERRSAKAVRPVTQSVPPTSASAAQTDGAPPDRIAAAAARVDHSLGTTLLKFYAAHPRQHFAVALHIESHHDYRWTDAPTADEAEQLALEACQQTYAAPCVLLATDLDLRAPDPKAGQRRDMERVSYAGPYRADLVPFQLQSRPPELDGYAVAREPKAMAIHPSGRVRVYSGATDALAAEANALAACQRKDSSLPCFLYARGNQVVLPQRITEIKR